MKNKNKAKLFLKAVVVLAVAVAFILPGATAITDDTQTINKPVGIPQNAVLRTIKAAHTAQITPNNHVLNADDDVQISGWWPGDDILPTIALTPDGYPFITWTNEEDVSTSSIGYTYAVDPSSQDEWWTNGVVIALDGVSQLYYGDTARYDHDALQMMGVFLALDTEQSGGAHIPDYTDYNTWTYYTWESTSPDAKYATIDDDSYYHVETTTGSGAYDVWGPYNMYIYHEIYDVYDIPDCPICFHNDIIGNQGLGFFDGQSEELTAPASDPDMSNLAESFHTVIQYTPTEGPAKIVWKKIVSAEEPDYEYTPYQETIADGTNPSIAAYVSGEDTHVAVVYTDGGAIKCIYSSDDGATWETPVVVASSGAFPNICVKDSKFLAAYIDDGNLFTVESTDGGATWGTPEQINDVEGTVVDDENYVDLNEVGIVWIDERGDDLDVYFQVLGEIPTYPNLEVTSITGSTQGVAAVVKNTGEAPATNVAWTIQITGGILGRIDKTAEGTIASLAVSGEEAIGPTGMIIGLGAIEVVVSATCAEGKSVSATKDGTQFIIFTIIK